MVNILRLWILRFFLAGILGASFTLRNHVDGYAVEQQFPLNSPLLRGIRVVRVRMWRSAQAGARAWMYLPLCGMLMWEGNRSR